MNFIRSLMQVKGLSANTKKSDSGAIDANNNNESMTTKIEKAKSNEPTPATIVTVLNRFLTSVYLGHHLLLIWAHFSIHQPFPFKPYQLVSNRLMIFQNNNATNTDFFFIKQFIRIFGNLLFGVIAGFVFHLTIEAPVSNVIQQLFGKYLSHGENAKKHID